MNRRARQCNNLNLEIPTEEPRQPRRACACAVHQNPNRNLAEDVCNLVKPSTRTWLPILLLALVLFQVYTSYQFRAQQHNLENAEEYSMQTRRGLWEISREHRRLVEEIGVKLDELKDRLKSIDDREMNIDVGEIDYALDGKVLSVGSSDNEKNLTSPAPGWFSCDCNPTVSRPPQTILTPSHLPGDCWSVEIENAIATIQLTTPIHITAITLEHLHFSKSKTGKTTSAPKFFSMWGVKQNSETAKQNGETIKQNKELLDCLGSFEYDALGPAVQTFKVKDHVANVYSLVRMQVFTNHGHPDYTCIYRIRVHGVPSSEGKNLQEKCD